MSQNGTLNPAHTGTRAPGTPKKRALGPQEPPEVDFFGGTALVNLTTGTLQPAHAGTKAPRTPKKPALGPQEPSELDFLGGTGPVNLTERHFAAGTRRHKGPQDAQEAGT